MQKPEKWKRLSSKTLFENSQISVQEDEVLLPDGTKTTYVFTPSKQDSVIVIAVSGDKLLLQRELSYPTGEILWQLPGGSLNINEPPVAGALRELSEESGYSAREKYLLGYYFAQNRKSNKKQYVVLCKDLFEKKSKSDPDEFIDTQFISIKRVKRMISTNEIKNINLLAALNLWFHNLSETKEAMK